MKKDLAASTNLSDVKLHELAKSELQFGFKLFAAIASSQARESIFVSPASVAIALAMVYNAARGETQRAMAEALELNGMSLDEINRANAAVQMSLQDFDPQVLLTIANSLWGDENIHFNPEFIQNNEEFYYAQISQVDFVAPETLSTINGWVREATQQKIKTIITQAHLGPATVMVLINAIYFKGIWTTQFDKAQTKPGAFNLPDGKQWPVQMMRRSGEFNYCETDGFQAVSLPYGNGRLGMYVFLPRPDSNLDEFLSHLNTETWKAWLAQFHEMEGDLTLPQFKMEYGIELSDVLSCLGMQIAFSTQADFSGMCDGPVFISHVIHKTFVEVNEEGTEAAAATAVVMLRGMSLTHRFNMIVDRPFFFAIVDNETGLVLFMGSVKDLN